jgi:hypothetical protein
MCLKEVVSIKAPVLDAAAYLVGQLEEEQGRTQDPGFGQVGAEGNLAIYNVEGALLDEGREIQAAVAAKIGVEAAVDGEEATTDEEAAVETPTSDHGGGTDRKILPAGGMGEFPEDGTEEVARVGGRAAAAGGFYRAQIPRRNEGSDEGPLAIGDVGEEGLFEIGTGGEAGRG